MPGSLLRAMKVVLWGSGKKMQSHIVISLTEHVYMPYKFQYQIMC